jgi:hypothetical protein
MVDVFVDTFTAALIQLQPLMSAEPAPVLFFFAVDGADDGAVFVALDFFPGAPPATVDWSQTPVQLPTIPGQLDGREVGRRFRCQILRARKTSCRELFQD